MGIRKTTSLKTLWNRHFGFMSKRKFGFLHSSWEVIKARKTGTTHSFLDYVVYRLFYVLTLCGFSVYKLSQTPTSYLLYFETWILMVHTIYSFVFLRQVLAHNHHRKPLGRRQKMPEQMVITDEIERGGQKYYISKKISILPRNSISAYEKLVWFMFTSSANLSFLGLLLVHISLKLLERHKGKYAFEESPLLIHLSFVLSFADIFINTIPVRLGHFIYGIFTCSIYFLIAYIYDSIAKEKNHLYEHDIYMFPINLQIIGLSVLCHFLIVILARLRDFIISLLDRTRTQAYLQQVRTQKRLARRKIMFPIYGPDGELDRIVLEYGQGALAQDQFIMWDDDGKEEDWAGSSSSKEEEEEEGQEVKIPKGGLKKVAPIISTQQPQVKQLPVKNLEQRIWTNDDKPRVDKGGAKNISDIRLPSPPKEGWNKKRAPTAPELPQDVSEITITDTERAMLGAYHREFQTKLHKTGMEALEGGRPNLEEQYRHHKKTKGQEEEGSGGENVKGFGHDTELASEHKKYHKAHKEHEISRLTGLATIPTASKGGTSAPPKKRSVDGASAKAKSLQQKGILNTKKKSTFPKRNSLHRQSLLNKRGGQLLDPVYDPVVTPNIPHAVTTFHYLDTKLTKQTEQGAVPHDKVGQFTKHPGVPIYHPKDNGVAPSQHKHHHKQADHSEEKASVLSFHPLIQYYDIKGADDKQESYDAKKSLAATKEGQPLSKENSVKSVASDQSNKRRNSK